MAGLSEPGGAGAGPGTPTPDARAGGRAGARLLHADAHLLAFDKPSGLLAVPGRGAEKQDCLSARAQRLYPNARVAHRLDQATSGLFLMARGPQALRALSAAFERREVAKRYMAVVAGRLAPAGDADADLEGWSLIDLPLSADWPRRPLQKVDPGTGRPSLTRWRVLAHEGGDTRVELEPLTGRTHQLRVHLQALGHPILGDALYAPPAVQAAAPRLLLHASALALAHPASGEPLRFTSLPPF